MGAMERISAYINNTKSWLYRYRVYVCLAVCVLSVLGRTLEVHKSLTGYFEVDSATHMTLRSSGRHRAVVTHQQDQRDLGEEIPSKTSDRTYSGYQAKRNPIQKDPSPKFVRDLSRRSVFDPVENKRREHSVRSRPYIRHYLDHLDTDHQAADEHQYRDELDQDHDIAAKRGDIHQKVFDAPENIRDLAQIRQEARRQIPRGANFQQIGEDDIKDSNQKPPWNGEYDQYPDHVELDPRAAPVGLFQRKQDMVQKTPGQQSLSKDQYQQYLDQVKQNVIHQVPHIGPYRHPIQDNLHNQAARGGPHQQPLDHSHNIPNEQAVRAGPYQEPLDQRYNIPNVQVARAGLYQPPLDQGYNILNERRAHGGPYQPPLNQGYNIPNERRARRGPYQPPSDPFHKVPSQYSVHTVPNPVLVLLVTYYRGGSTFLGEAFNQNPHGFYWFEPLHGHRYREVKYSDAVNGAFREQNGTVRHLDDSITSKEVEVLINIFTCKLADLDSLYLGHEFVTYSEYSASLGPYRRCLQLNRFSAMSISDSIRACLSLAIDACKSAGVRVIKTIRVGVYMVSEILERIPNVRIIFSTRDPRGILNSRSRLENGRDISADKLRTHARHLCAEMHDDFVNLQSLDRTGANIIRTRYESLATLPIDTLTTLYDQLSLVLPREVTNWFEINTNARMANKGNGYGVKRTNSAVIAYEWRDKISFKEKEIIVGQCHLVLKEYGYNV